MATPHLPFEILHIIFSNLADDRGSLYSIALSSRRHSKIALQILYTNLSDFPDVDDEDPLAEDPGSYTNRLIKWSSLWKSLAFSSQNPTSTTIAYASALRVLDLQDLTHLMEELRTLRGQRARTKFFAEGLEQYNKVHPNSTAKQLDVKLAVDCLTDLISSSTNNVSKIIGYSHDPRRLCLWLENMPALKKIKMFSGAPLADEQVRYALSKCYNLKALEIYRWAVYQESDAQLASLLSAIPGEGLKSFILTDGSVCFGDLSVNALIHRHGPTLTELEISELNWPSFCSLTTAQGLTNLRYCLLHNDRDNRYYSTLDDNTATAVSQFFANNTHLQHLSLRISSVERILGPAIPKLRLNSLHIDHQEDHFPNFGTFLSTQSDTLEELTLRHVGWDDHAELGLHAGLVMGICTLHKLKRLIIISPCSSLITNAEAGEIAANCPKLEHLTLDTGALGDEALDHLATLTNLTEFHPQTSNTFTVNGIRRFIQSRPTLTAMSTYVLAEQFPPEDIVELKDLLSSRGGVGLMIIEESNESGDEEERNWDSDFEP